MRPIRIESDALVGTGVCPSARSRPSLRANSFTQFAYARVESLALHPAARPRDRRYDTTILEAILTSDVINKW